MIMTSHGDENEPDRIQYAEALSFLKNSNCNNRQPPQQLPLPPPLPQQQMSAAMQKSLLELGERLTCSLCAGILVQPVTIPCGHTFCCRCIDRHTDHSWTCPSTYIIGMSVDRGVFFFLSDFVYLTTLFIYLFSLHLCTSSHHEKCQFQISKSQFV